MQGRDSDSRPHAMTTAPARTTGLRRWTERLGRWFPPNPVRESVSTRAWFDATPQQVWNGIVFYEDVPGRASWFLRLFLPAPVRTEGGKAVGTVVRCTYDQAHLIKQITASEPGRLLGFDVLEQRLGVESCITLGEGSYAIEPGNGGCEVVLTTHYRGHCRPRFLARLLERQLAHGVHRFILQGMRAKVAELKGHRPALDAVTPGTASQRS